MSAEHSSEDHGPANEYFLDVDLDDRLEQRDSVTRPISRSANDIDPPTPPLEPSIEKTHEHQMDLLAHRDNATSLLSGGLIAWHNLDIPDPIIKFASTVLSGMAVTIGVRILAWGGQLIQSVAKRAMHKWRTRSTKKVEK